MKIKEWTNLQKARECIVMAMSLHIDLYDTKKLFPSLKLTEQELKLLAKETPFSLKELNNAMGGG